MRKWALAMVAVVALAGCGGGSSSKYGGGGTASGKSAPTAGGPITVRKLSIGSALVDSSGRTLYVFARDTKGHSNCSGACATNWPPEVSPASPKAGSGVTQSKLTAIKRSDGSRQVAYAGQPLYRFSGDQAAGDTNGQGQNAFGGLWYAVSASGAPLKSGGSGGGNSGGASPGGY
jgi:predicted lipoprotein with Yx(FWY)xxD motif